MKYSGLLRMLFMPGGDEVDGARAYTRPAASAVELWSWWDKDCEAVADAG